MAGERFEQRVKFWQTDLAYKAPEQLASRTAAALDDLIATARAEFQAAGVLEVREAPDLAKELIAWLDNNVMRCGHGTIGVSCHLCMRDHPR